MQLLKHINNTDVAIEPIKTHAYLNSKGTMMLVIKARWWNIAGEGPHVLPIGNAGVWTFRIPRDKWKEWRPWKRG